MRFEKGHKEETRKRIIEVASECFRRDGIEAVGIAGLMAEAGLTHGGFYAHFGSKEELVREALAAAFDGARRRRGEGANVSLEAYVRSYLRPNHRDAPAKGCSAAALIAEITRHESATREVFTENLEAITTRIAALLPAEIVPAARKSTATAIFGLMLGTLQFARAVTDREWSDTILESGIAAVLKLGQASAS
jgi:AcrR family transcriptional regulator